MLKYRDATVQIPSIGLLQTSQSRHHCRLVHPLQIVSQDQQACQCSVRHRHMAAVIWDAFSLRLRDRGKVWVLKHCFSFSLCVCYVCTHVTMVSVCQCVCVTVGCVCVCVYKHVCVPTWHICIHANMVCMCLRVCVCVCVCLCVRVCVCVCVCVCVLGFYSHLIYYKIIFCSITSPQNTPSPSHPQVFLCLYMPLTICSILMKPFTEQLPWGHPYKHVLLNYDSPWGDSMRLTGR